MPSSRPTITSGCSAGRNQNGQAEEAEVGSRKRAAFSLLRETYGLRVRLGVLTEEQFLSAVGHAFDLGYDAGHRSPRSSPTQSNHAQTNQD